MGLKWEIFVTQLTFACLNVSTVNESIKVNGILYELEILLVLQVLRLRRCGLIKMFKIQIKSTFFLWFINLNIQLFKKFFHQSDMIHWITKVRAINFNEKLMAFTITYPFQQSFIPFSFNFFWIRWVHLSSIRCKIFLGLMNIIWQHHLVYHHIFESRSFFSCIGLYHLLLNNKLLLSWQFIKVFFW